VVHVDDPQAAGSVVFFYHADGTLWRAVPLEQLNPGWVTGTYRFRGDMRKFDTRLARMRTRLACPSWQTCPTFWATAGWQRTVVYVPLGLVWRIHHWQCSSLPEPQVVTSSDEQVERLNQARPADVQQLLAVREQREAKVIYQIGGLHLLLNYVERIGLVEAVNCYCTRDGAVSDGTVIAVLVINRLLSPRPLSRIDEWVEDTGLHLLLGIDDPQVFNYDRLADALLAVYPHWQDIATGYSRDKRSDKRQVNIGISATADGEVVLPGGSGIHSGDTNDGTTTVSTHEQLHKLFQRSDLPVTGDSIMHDAENMPLISRAHGRFLGATKMTPHLRKVVAACLEEEFETLPTSTEKAGHEVKAAFRRLQFEAKVKLSPAERERAAEWRRQRRIRGRIPTYRKVHFWMRAAVILDTDHQERDAQRCLRRIAAYEAELKWTLDHLNRGRYCGDPEWVSRHLADLAHQFKDVHTFVKVDFTVQDEKMSLSCRRYPARIAEAAKLDGRWVLVTNQRRETGRSLTDYLDWMWNVYKNHHL